MLWLSVFLLLLALGLPVHAQVGATLDACLEDSTVTVPAAGQVTVDATAGGVTVLAANRKRCQGLIKNTGAATMNCAPASQTVSATVGWPIAAGETFGLRSEGRAEWKCIRTTGTSTTAATAEAVSR